MDITLAELRAEHLGALIRLEDGPREGPGAGSRPYAVQGSLQAIEHSLGEDGHPIARVAIAVYPRREDVITLQRGGEHAATLL